MTALGIARRLASCADPLAVLWRVGSRLDAYRLYVRAGAREYDTKYLFWQQVERLLNRHIYNGATL